MSNVVELIAFGFRGDKLDELRATVELVLGITMQARNSDRRGGDYFWCGSFEVVGEEFRLQRNFIVAEQELDEPRFADFGALLYVANTARGAEIAAALARFAKFFYREEYSLGR